MSDPSRLSSRYMSGLPANADEIEQVVLGNPPVPTEAMRDEIAAADPAPNRLGGNLQRTGDLGDGAVRRKGTCLSWTRFGAALCSTELLPFEECSLALVLEVGSGS